MYDDLEIPEFLRVTPERAAARRQTWIDNPPKATPGFSRELTETEKLYYESIERDKAIKRELDRPRFEAMRAKALAAKAELDAVKQAAAKATRLRRAKFRTRVR